ncbi:MAG TPA: hypothetical protein VHI51_05460 [Ktedonobacterales bacterium]|jgi:hypothetical protein|nr:hypothetical protein [Ktedonobacterales bacterium]
MSASERERLRRGRLLSALHLTAVVLLALILPRGFLPVLDPGTLAGVAGFAVIVFVSILLNRRGVVTAASLVFTAGLALAIAGSQLATPGDKINFQDLAGYDLLVIPLVVASFLLSSRAVVLLWSASVLFVVVDLGLASHGVSLDAYLPSDLPPFVRIYPVAIYPIILTAVVGVISWLAARSTARALAEADRTADVERAYALLADHNRQLEESIGAIQQAHARVARGDLGARAAIRPGDPLLQVASSLNLLLDRLARGNLSTAALAEVERETQVLHGYLAALAEAKFQTPLPGDQLRRLAPLGYGLEQVRALLLQAIQSARTLTEQVARDTQVVNDHVRRLEAPTPADPEQTSQLRRDVEALYADISRLYQYLGQFL